MTKYILIAGTSEKNFELAKDVIRDLDYEIVKAPSMSLALYLAQKNSPIFILSGAELVDGDPITFAASVKSDRELATIPLFFLLDKEQAQLLKPKLLATGASAVLTDVVQTKGLLSDLVC